MNKPRATRPAVGTAPTLAALVSNALDFLAVATRDFEQRPKQSVIAFYTAVELILKARLMAEHWSLVVTKSADLVSFRTGDFQSVTFEEACSRLARVVSSSLPEGTRRSFDDLRKHRNKMVHFFHEGETDETVREQIALEQLLAWHGLDRLLRAQWRDVFAPLNIDLHEIDQSFRKHRLYLQARFESLKETLNRLREAGKKIDLCRVCAFEAAEVSDEGDGFFSAQCHVCRRIPDRWLTVPCFECEQPLRLEGDDGATCEHCDTRFSVEELAEQLDKEVYTKDNYMDARTPGNCSSCDGYHTVVEWKGSYLCVACLHLTDEMSFCGWCNEPNNGDMEMSEWAGCNHCEGRGGWTRDD